MNTLEYVDSAIRSLTDDYHRDLMARWRQEYAVRYYGTRDGDCLPKPHSGYPGFEANLHALLCNQMKSKDPHSEWPYASYVERSTERVDLHLFIDTVEVWIEIGMYASDEKAKYYKDFLKLVSVIEAAPTSIGVLIHFEVYPRGVVLGILDDIKTQFDQQYTVDIQPFLNAEQVLAYRLSVQATGS